MINANDLFFDCMTRHKLNFKSLAADSRFRFHVAERQIRKYASGECEVPLWAMAALYDMTKDMSLIKAIVGDDEKILSVPESRYPNEIKLAINSLTEELEKCCRESSKSRIE